jgi:hypothetical protein
MRTLGGIIACLALTGCQSQLLTRTISIPKESAPFYAPEPAQQVAYEAKLREREAAAERHGGGKCACCN